MDQNSIFDTWRRCLTLEFYSLNTRIRRREFWAFFLLWCIASSLLGYGLLPSATTLTGLALLVPFVAVMIRRLHDLGKPDHWILLLLLPGLGFLILLGLACLDGEPNDNQWGANPKAL